MERGGQMERRNIVEDGEERMREDSKRRRKGRRWWFVLGRLGKGLGTHGGIIYKRLRCTHCPGFCAKVEERGAVREERRVCRRVEQRKN